MAAAELIAIAAFYEGKYSQAFPNFGVERRGAPVEAYCRISDRPIRLREQVYAPEVVIIQDVTLIESLNMVNGLKPRGVIIINSEKQDWPQFKKFKCYAVPITKLAVEFFGRPITNTGLLAAFATITGLIKFESLEKAVKELFEGKPEIVEKNISLMKKICQECLK